MNIFVNRIHIAKKYIRLTGELKLFIFNACRNHLKNMMYMYTKDLISLALHFYTRYHEIFL